MITLKKSHFKIKSFPLMQQTLAAHPSMREPKKDDAIRLGMSFSSNSNEKSDKKDQ
jgi:predicted hotdog family 3-hydroxylacyl-ACP dehydratase